MRQKISVRAIIKNNDKTLFLRRGIGRASILGKYELPGGSLDFKEQPQDALKRYVRHNLGSEIETIQLFDVASFIDPDDPQVQYIFIVYHVSLSNNTINVSGRYDKYVWKLLQDMQQNLLTNSTIMVLGLANSKDDMTNISEVNIDNDVINSSEKTIIYSDGGSRGNPGPSASAFIIMDNNEQIIADGGVYLGITTNNQAEYQAVYQALKKASELNIRIIDFKLDSNLVVNQLNGIYKIKNRDLWPIYQDIKELVNHFEKVTFTHIGREFNHVADKLVNQILDEQTRTHQ